MNKTYKNTISTLFLIFFFIGCATKPEAISPAYVSHLGYMNLSCEQLGQEQARLVAALSTASDAQRLARSNDTAGVLLLGLPVSSLSGSNQASNIARLKGEVEALQKAMVAKGCGGEIVNIDDVIKKKESNKEQPKPNSIKSTDIKNRK